MHFRVRKNVVQLIRVNYDAGKKKGVNTVVGSVRLMNLELSNELRESLSPEEVMEFDAWARTQHHADRLKDELAALTLSEGMSRAGRWFEQERSSETAHMVAAEILAQWQLLRRLLIKNGLIE